MKLTVTTYFIIAVLCLGLIGVTARWIKYKNFPEETVTEETFEIDRDRVKNAQANKTYYGTRRITTQREALGWPSVDVTIKYDTLTVDEGGFFGVPN